jgi:UDP-galactose 4-epimerase (EC 5.1.3.2)
VVEHILADYDRAYGLRSVCLRYFNAAGADLKGNWASATIRETHLIPLVLQAASGRRSHIHVFGTDYETPDGSCLRDYIHVQDLCSAHQLALEWLQKHDQSQQFNLGNSDGYSVLEVIMTAREVTGKEIPVVIGDRRVGDPARLIADATLAQQRLGWKPGYPDLADMIAHAWQWEQSI